MNPAKTLDERYLEFTHATQAIFAEYPQIEPWRYYIFRELGIRQTACSFKDHASHWLQPLRIRRRTATPPAPCDVLIWVESARDVIVDALLPVYHALRARGVSTLLVSSGGPQSLPAYRFCPHDRSFTPPWAREAWSALCDAVPSGFARSSWRLFAYAAAWIQGFFDQLDALLDAAQPRLVLAASTQLPGGAALIVAARRRRLRQAVLQHGILQPLYVPLLSDVMLTWGASSSDVLASFGTPREALVALGSPRHDRLGRSDNGNARERLLETAGLPGRPTLVFFSNGNDLLRNGYAPLECAAWLENVAARVADRLNVIVRLHPNEDGSLYRDCPHLSITKHAPGLSTVLEGCDVVASLCSTVLYDALLYGKPVWQFHVDSWPDLAHNWKDGLAERLASRQELEDAADRWLRERPPPRVDDRKVERVFANHGRATEAVADYIVRCLESPTDRAPARWGAPGPAVGAGDR
jgi:hypothetical protein